MVAFRETTTGNLPRLERVPQWREWIGKQFSGLDSDEYGDADFIGQMRSAQLGDFGLTELTAGRHRVRMEKDAARRTEASMLKIVAPWEGFACVEQRGRSALVRAGQWTIYDTTVPYVITNPSHVRHLIVVLPRERLTSRGLLVDDLVSRPLTVDSLMAGQALRMMRDTMSRVGQLEREGEAVAATVGQLTEVIYDALVELSGDMRAGSQRTVLRTRICRHVSDHLRDADLSAQSIAAALKCSRRYLHNAFGGGEDTLFRYVLRQRLEACMNELRAPTTSTQIDKKITDIALGWGFNNLSHFSREFRSYTGVSPRAYRALCTVNQQQIPVEPCVAPFPHGRLNR